MAGNTVTLTFAGDSKSLERTFDNVGTGAKKMAGDLDNAGGKAKSFGSAMDTAGSAADASESKFMGAADVLDGLGGVFGVNISGATDMARSLGDLTGGFATLQPLLGTVGTALKTGVGGAMSFIAAHPVMFTLAALTAAFVLLWQHSETFRNIVRAAFEKVGEAVTTVKNLFVGAYNWANENWHKLESILTAPFNAAGSVISTAFNAILSTFKGTWNAIAGFISGLDFTINVPDILPGPSKYTIGLPDLPMFKAHQGGVVPGPPGAEVPILALAGERVIPAGQSAGGEPVAVHVFIDGREIHQSLLRLQRTSGSLGLVG